ncbi:DUF3280 domain-containing protein [Bradyrhizobium lablabi]|nr:DUF3280 domain-containing protein [Bradyrhizobium lablabi]
MCINRLTLRDRAARFAGIALFFAALTIPLAARAQTSGPVKLAIFEFELEDFSGGSGIVEETPVDTAELKRATSEARQLIAQSGRYDLVDVSTADADPVKRRSLRNCNGCDAGIALTLGADQSLTGIIKRISRTEYAVGVQVRSARDGAVIFNKQTDLQIGANYSWNRGVNRLIQKTLLAGQAPQ